jgi:ABC-type Zn uptake system ZnuABC Zn-binding protein ZnuA
MAQLSFNTVFYDQLVKNIQSFISKYNKNEFSTYQQMSEQYNKLISDINRYSGSQISKYDPYIKRRTICIL